MPPKKRGTRASKRKAEVFKGIVCQFTNYGFPEINQNGSKFYKMYAPLRLSFGFFSNAFNKTFICLQQNLGILIIPSYYARKKQPPNSRVKSLWMREGKEKI